MKKSSIIILSAIASVCFLFACACGKGTDEGRDSSSGQSQSSSSSSFSGDSSSSSSSSSASEEITGITFEDANYDYDGTEKIAEISGELPVGVSVTYQNNKGIDAGRYTAKAILSGEGYQTLTLTATLTINKIDMTGLTFSDESVEYDANTHSVYLQGNPPQGASVTYRYGDAEKEGETEVGTYIVTVTVMHKNYNDFTAKATLTIKSTEEVLSSVYCNGNVYFQNNLDGNALYRATSSSLEKVNSDVAAHMVASNGTVYYVSEGLISSSVKALNVNGDLEKVCSASAKSLVSDGTYLYYSVNNTLLNTSKNGIYRIKADGSEETAVRITTDKAEYLNYYNGYLYYSNVSQGNKLYKISALASGASGTALDDEKVSYMILEDGVLYYNSAKTVGAAVCKYVISENKKVKLTTDAGKYLAKCGNYIYYVNNDLLTGKIFGDGIYRVDATSKSDQNTSGEKIFSAESNGYSSLMSDGTYLYYYKLNDKHFYRLDLSAMTEKDLMANFVAPKAELTGYADICEYNGQLYYIDPTDGGCLYRYDLTTKAKVKIVADSVAGVWLHKNYLYYSTYLLTNYALWRTDLTTNETEKISSDRFDCLRFADDEIYAVKVGSLYNNHIYKMNEDGTQATELYDKDNLWVADFVKEGDYIYYARNPKIYSKRLCRYSISQNKTEVLNESLKAEAFTVSGDKIFVATSDNKLYVTDIDGKNEKAIATNVSVNDLTVLNGVLYYSSSHASNTGLYSYDIKSGKTTKLSDENAHGMTVCGGKLYFLRTAIGYLSDYPIIEGNENNSGKLCCYDGTRITEIA